MAHGGDHIASTVNTPALAYAGVALPILILLARSVEEQFRGRPEQELSPLPPDPGPTAPG